MYSLISGSLWRDYWFLTCECFAGRHQVTRTFERSKCPYSGAYFLCFQVCYSAHRLYLTFLLSWISIPSNCEPEYTFLPWDVSAGCFGYSNTTGTVTGYTVKCLLMRSRVSTCVKRTGHRYGVGAGITASRLLTWMTSLCNPVKILLFFQKNKKNWENKANLQIFLKLRNLILNLQGRKRLCKSITVFPSHLNKRNITGQVIWICKLLLI